MSYQVVPLTGLEGGVAPEGAALTGTQLLPFQTFRTAGTAPVSYQVAPVFGLRGGVPLETEGKV